MNILISDLYFYDFKWILYGFEKFGIIYGIWKLTKIIFVPGLTLPYVHVGCHMGLEWFKISDWARDTNVPVVSCVCALELGQRGDSSGGCAATKWSSEHGHRLGTPREVTEIQRSSDIRSQGGSGEVHEEQQLTTSVWKCLARDEVTRRRCDGQQRWWTKKKKCRGIDSGLLWPVPLARRVRAARRSSQSTHRSSGRREMAGHGGYYG
jgi:hypothetical protein